MLPFELCAFADEAGEALRTQISALSENQIPYLEIRGVNGRSITQYTESEAAEVKKMLSDHGLKVWSIGSPLGKIKITDDFAAHLDLFRRTLNLARVLEAPCIRLFSFYLPEQEDPAPYRDTVMEYLNRFLEEAKGSGVLLCHENEKGIYGENAARCADIYKTLPELRGIFDPANFIQCDQETLRAYELLAPYIYYIHIKDATAEKAIVPAGKGIGHIPEILTQYAARGGKIVTIEPHLTVFKGLSELEGPSERSEVGKVYSYPTQRAAFDAACQAVKEIIG